MIIGLGRAAADEPDHAGMSSAISAVKAHGGRSEARDAGMPILYRHPADVGADRIVNSIAAYEQYGRTDRAAAGRRRLRDGDDARRDHAPKGEYLGGAICPGRADLGRRVVPARGAAAADRRAQAARRSSDRTTVGAMESGLFWGYVGMVEGLVRRMSDELGGPAADRLRCDRRAAPVIAPETTARSATWSRI